MKSKTISISVTDDTAAAITREAYLQCLSRSAFIVGLFNAWQQAKKEHTEQHDHPHASKYEAYDVDELIEEMNAMLGEE